MAEKSEAGTKATAGVENERLDDASLGDLIRVERGRHSVDEGAYRGTTAGGDVKSRGKGGEAVWRQAATPEERAVLERYFQ